MARIEGRLEKTESPAIAYYTYLYHVIIKKVWGGDNRAEDGRWGQQSLVFTKGSEIF